jgi:hypothetical protein
MFSVKEIEAMARVGIWKGLREAQERRSDMRTYEYELWQKVEYGPEDEHGEVETIRKEKRIGEKRERFSANNNIAAGSLSGDVLLEFLQDHLAEIAEAGLKLTDVEVRARPFPA